MTTVRSVILQNTQMASPSLCSILFSMRDEQIATGLSTKDTATQKLRHLYSSLWVLLQFVKCERAPAARHP